MKRLGMPHETFTGITRNDRHCYCNIDRMTDEIGSIKTGIARPGYMFSMVWKAGTSIGEPGDKYLLLNPEESEFSFSPFNIRLEGKGVSVDTKTQ